MKTIFNQIEEKKQADIQKAVEARGAVIEATRNKVLEVLKQANISVGDALIVCRTTQEKLQMDAFEKMML